MALTSTALSDLRKYIRRRVGSAKYYLGGVAYAATVQSVTVMQDGIVRVILEIEPNTFGTVTKVELYNTDGSLWASNTVSITLSESLQKILYWYDFTIEEASNV